MHFLNLVVISSLRPIRRQIGHILLIAALFGLSACGGNGGDETEVSNADVLPAVQYSKSDPGCLNCHEKLEQFHENVDISCTDCHGGDFTAEEKELAHIQSSLDDPSIYKSSVVPPKDEDLAYQKFVNPSNLRVVDETCGQCHEKHTDNVKKSMMATSTGHHAGGLYLGGVQDTKQPTFSTFAIEDLDGEVPVSEGAVQQLPDLLDYDQNADQSKFETHYAAVPGQACVRCHLWTRGKGYRGAKQADGTGLDGLYRADGCAACHVIYANDGISKSEDTSINKDEKGHPLIHRVTSAIPSEQCIHCHHRGARIGLSFQGKSQMPPGLPSGPDIAGTTDEKFNTNYHYADSETNPIDVHAEKGMECIDCHTQAGIMGDGNVYGHMDQATKIECRTCHGTPTEEPTLIDKDGLPLNNVERQADGKIILTGKVSGNEHVVPRIAEIVNPDSEDFNAKAAAAMDENHIKEDGGLECFACHQSWSANCFGCHFERDEEKTGVNLITHEEVDGKASTNNKMWVSLKHFAMGNNSQGKASPFIVGCHPIADVTAKDGTKKLDFVMPETVNGKSGLGFNPSNSHSTRSVGEVRECAECHQSPPALGMGSGNYSLGRTHQYVLAADGIRVYERWKDPTNPEYIETISGPAEPTDLAVIANVVTGRADYLIVSFGTAGVEIYDMRDGIPSTSTSIGGVNAISVSYAARYLYIVDKDKGVAAYDLLDPLNPTLASSVSIPNAQQATLWGIDLFVAAGESGLVVVDAKDHLKLNITGELEGINAVAVRLYAHFQPGSAYASRAYVADPDKGVHVVDLLPSFSNPTLVTTLPLVGAMALDSYTRYVLVDVDLLEAEQTPSREHDYLYVAAGVSGLAVYDISMPDAIEKVATLDSLGGAIYDVDVVSQPTAALPASVYDGKSKAGVFDYASITNSVEGLQTLDVSDPTDPVLKGSLAVSNPSKVLVDVQQMDRFIDEQGNELKENSHPGARAFEFDQIVRILRALDK